MNKGFPNEPDVGYRNFFIPRVEKTSKNEPAYFKVFYNPRDEEISIPDINGHSENLFLFEFIYVQNLFDIFDLSLIHISEPTRPY